MALLCRTYDVDDDGDIVVHEKKSDDHRQADERQVTDERHRERKCADTIGTVLVPWAGHFQC